MFNRSFGPQAQSGVDDVLDRHTIAATAPVAEGRISAAGRV